MRLRTLGLRSAATLLVLGIACAGPDPDGSVSATTAASDTGHGSEVSGTGRPDDADVTGTSAGSESGDAPCEPVTVPLSNPERPVGVVLVVDNSPGMGEEAAEVSTHLVAFASRLSARIATTLVVISAILADDPQGVCVDPPLGNGGCPASDHAPPAYVHVATTVAPIAALGQVLVSHAQWATALPEGAKRHLVVVSDGDTGVAVDEFREAFLALEPELGLGHRIHVSVAHDACEHATNPGEGFRAHAAASGGYDHDLCTQDYAAFFEQLGDRVLDDLGDRCRWELPAAPAGAELHPDQVELLIDADALMTSLPRVGSEAECDAAAPGWYWEDPAAPAAMRACPETCTLLLGFGTVESSVRFGCPPAAADGG